MMKDDTHFIMGKNTLLEVLRHKKEILVKVFLSENRKDVEPLLKEKNIPFEYVSKKRLFSLVHSDSHQSVVAKIKKRTFASLEEFLQKKSASILMLDSIYDPQNMGALIRVAECFQIDALLFSKNKGCGITPVVTKAASGATELVPLIKVSNLAEAIRKCKQHGYEIIVADVGENTQSLWNFSFSEKTAFLFGAEGKGVQYLHKKLADKRLTIPMLGKIDSLNVSQSAAVFLSFFRFKTLAKTTQ